MSPRDRIVQHRTLVLVCMKCHLDATSTDSVDSYFHIRWYFWKLTSCGRGNTWDALRADSYPQIDHWRKAF
eukprot:1899948-Prymnesium_polylepis.1